MWCSVNSSLGAFCVDFENFGRFADAPVLFRSFHTKIIQSTTAITSIVASLRSQILRIAIRCTNQLRIKCEFLIFRHTERSEVSKSCDFNQAKDTMTQNSESYRFAQSKQVANDSKVAKMDSSLRATRYAQNDGISMDCFGQSPSNDNV